MNELPLCFALWGLRRMLNEYPPNPWIIESACGFMACYPREELPDWVEIVANGDIDNLGAVIEIAKADISWEGQNAS